MPTAPRLRREGHVKDEIPQRDHLIEPTAGAAPSRRGRPSGACGLDDVQGSGGNGSRQREAALRQDVLELALGAL